MLGAVEVEIQGETLSLPSLLKKDRSEKEILSHKIQFSLGKIFGKDNNEDLVKVSINENDQLTLKTQDPAALQRLSHIFEGKCEQRANEILVTLNAREVRSELTKEAIRIKDSKKEERRKQKVAGSVDNADLPGSVINRPTSNIVREDQSRERN